MVGVENRKSATNGVTVDISVALSPTDLKSVPSLLAEIASLGSSLDDGDNHARLALLQKAKALVTALETPRETMIKHNWAEVSVPVHPCSPSWFLHWSHERNM
jgi:hypothetical protein